MNKRQRMVLIAALAILTVMLLFPPRYHAVSVEGRETRYFLGYVYITKPLPRASRIDLPRLVWPIGAVCLMALLAYLELQDGT